MPGLLTRLGRRLRSSRGKGRVWEKIRVKAEAEREKRYRA